MAKSISVEEAVAQLTAAIRADIISRMIGAEGHEVTNGVKSKTVKAPAIKRGKRGKYDEAKVLEILGNKEMKVADLATEAKVGTQTMTKNVKAATTKFKVRNETEGNSRSALLVKAK